MRALELKVPPPVVALAFCAAMWFAAGIGPVLDVPFALRVGAFVVIALCGGGVALAGDIEFRRARTTINPLRPEKASALVSSGIYRFTRNPMYVGLALVTFGWAAFLCSALALLGPPGFVLYITRFQIVPEERILSDRFGAAYAAYRARVGRWLPVSRRERAGGT